MAVLVLAVVACSDGNDGDRCFRWRFPMTTVLVAFSGDNSDDWCWRCCCFFAGSLTREGEAQARAFFPFYLMTHEFELVNRIKPSRSIEAKAPEVEEDSGAGSNMAACSDSHCGLRRRV